MSGNDNFKALLDKSSEVGKRTTEDLKRAKELGITTEQVMQAHPEFTRSSEETAAGLQRAAKISAGVTVASGLAGGIIPLVVPEIGRTPGKNWLVRSGLAVVAAGVAATGAVVATVAALGKPVLRKSIATGQLENAVLEQEIAKAEARQGTVVPAPDAPAVNATTPATDVPAAKDFAAAVAPRDASFAVQAQKDAAQPSQPALSA